MISIDSLLQILCYLASYVVIMLHYFVGRIEDHGIYKFLLNDMFGIQIAYMWLKKNGSFFLYPYRDDNRKTISYYAFDAIDQREMFENVLKVSGIGAKTAFQIVQFPLVKIREAIENLDFKFFQNIPWIGPKTAKKLLLELKDSVKTEDFTKLNGDEKVYKNIVKSLKNLGYDTQNVKSILQKYEGTVSKEKIGEIIKWVIGKM